MSSPAWSDVFLSWLGLHSSRYFSHLPTSSLSNWPECWRGVRQPHLIWLDKTSGLSRRTWSVSLSHATLSLAEVNARDRITCHFQRREARPRRCLLSGRLSAWTHGGAWQQHCWKCVLHKNSYSARSNNISEWVTTHLLANILWIWDLLIRNLKP